MKKQTVINHSYLEHSLIHNVTFVLCRAAKGFSTEGLFNYVLLFFLHTNLKQSINFAIFTIGCYEDHYTINSSLCQIVVYYVVASLCAIIELGITCKNLKIKNLT